MNEMAIPKLCRNPDGRAYSTVPGSGGKRIYFGVHGTEEAEEKYRKWLGQILRSDPSPGPLIPTHKTTVGDLAAAYLDHAAGYYSRGGEPTGEYRNLRDSIRVLLRYAEDDLVSSFGPNSLRSVRDSMVRDGWKTENGHKRKYTRSYVNSTVNRIIRMFRWCESREMLSRGAAAHLRTVEPLRKNRGAQEKPPVQSVSWKDVKATLPYCRDDLAALITVQYWGGMRPSEACRICKRDLDMSRDIWLYTLPEHKTDDDGRVLVKALPVQARAALEPFVARTTDPCSPLFTTRFGRVYSPSAYGKAVLRAIDKARKAGESIPHWTPLQLRHSIAEAVDRLADRESAQHYLGHSRPDTTAIYAGRNISAILRVAQALSRIADEP